MTTPVVEQTALIASVAVDDGSIHVGLSDGRRLSTPIEWYPRLKAASPAVRSRFRLIGRGEGIHWPEADEDISLEGLLAGRKAAAE